MNFIKNLLYGNKINELLRHGREHLEDENYFAAITFFSHVINIDKNNLDGFFERGKTYLAVGNYEKALRDLRAIEKLKPEYNGELFQLLSKVCYNLGDAREYQKYAKLYYDLNAEKHKAAYIYARALYLNKNYDESLKLTDLIIADGVEDFYIRYLRSLILFDQNNFVSSLLEIDKAIENETLNCFAFNLRALINIQLYNYIDAVNDFNYAIRLNPTNPIYYFNKAKLQLKIGDLIDAKASINNCLDLDTENKNVHLLSAHINIISENYIEALESLNKALNIDPDDIAVLRSIVNLCYRLKDYNAAKIYLDKLKEKNPSRSDIFLHSAFVNYNVGNNEGTDADLISAFEKDRQNIEARVQKAVLDFKSGNFEGSIKRCDEVLEIDGTNEFVRLLKIRGLTRLGLFDEAYDELERFSANVENKEFYLLKSLLHLKKGDYEQALEILNDNLKENEHDTTQKILMNLLRLQHGDFDALEDLNEFKLEGENKKNVQILNAVYNFENNQYHSAKYRFSNLNDLSDEDADLIRPIIEYAETKIAD